MTIDWNRALQAEHRDTGAIAHKVALTGRFMDGVHEVGIGGGYSVWVSADGVHPHWFIRNVPEHPTPTQYAPELVERAIALIRRLSGGFYMPHLNDNGLSECDAVIEAKAIVSDLPQEVDPDLIEARKIAATAPGVHTMAAYGIRTGRMDDAPEVIVALAAIARGRQLQRGEAA